MRRTVDSRGAEGALMLTKLTIRNLAPQQNLWVDSGSEERGQFSRCNIPAPDVD